MNKTVDIQELAIVVATKNHNPTILTPDFLRYSGIIPGDWELAREPLYNNRVAQVFFQNGISIVAEPMRVMFLETIVGKAIAEVALPGIVRKYVETLPNLDYQAFGINPVGYVSFNDQPDAARKYISEMLLSAGSWHQVGTKPVRATVNLAYTLERRQFNLTINSSVLRLPDETTSPIVLFSGNFNYKIASNAGDERLAGLYQAIENWQVDLETYKDVVNTKFLAKVVQNTAVVPDLFATSPVAQIHNAQTLVQLTPLS